MSDTPLHGHTFLGPNGTCICCGDPGPEQGACIPQVLMAIGEPPLRKEELIEMRREWKPPVVGDTHPFPWRTKRHRSNDRFQNVVFVILDRRDRFVAESESQHVAEAIVNTMNAAAAKQDQVVELQPGVYTDPSVKSAFADLPPKDKK